jgi:hypothetical protein
MTDFLKNNILCNFWKLLCPTAWSKPSDIRVVYVRRLTPAVVHNNCGSHSQPVKRLAFTISDGRVWPSEIAYVRRLPSDITLFLTPNVRRLETVGDNQMPSDISYVRRFKSYVRRLWPSEVVSFTVVIPLVIDKRRPLNSCWSWSYQVTYAGLEI